MKRIKRLLFGIFALIFILFTIEKYLFSFERGQLLAWWFLQGKGWQSEHTIAARTESKDLEPYVNEIAEMLASSPQNSATQKAALSFAGEFKETPKVKEQLIILAHDHPDVWVRCYWKKRVLTGGKITIINTHEGEKTKTAFSLLDDECAPLTKPLTQP
jgi:hypothetical protein